MPLTLVKAKHLAATFYSWRDTVVPRNSMTFGITKGAPHLCRMLERSTTTRLPTTAAVRAADCISIFHNHSSSRDVASSLSYLQSLL
mmetsp:Transcript_34514/g.83712  ORF Transcript_34514/g.83712 Transcript_34514/m.83712 type:complete len:87 (-) Transcript_34514:1416-1676(-)